MLINVRIYYNKMLTHDSTNILSSINHKYSQMNLTFEQIYNDYYIIINYFSNIYYIYITSLYSFKFVYI